MPTTLAKAIFEKNGMGGDVVDGRRFHDSDAHAGASNARSARTVPDAEPVEILSDLR